MPRNLGERLTDAPDAADLVFNNNDLEAGQAILSTVAGAPGSTFVTLIRIDTTGKHTYVWDGDSYVLIADYA